MSRTNPRLVTPTGIGTFAKLKGVAAAAGRPTDLVAQRFAMEAAIRRIFASDHADRFGVTTSLKGGALMFFAEGVDPVHGRTTSDIDLQLTGWQGTMDDLKTALQEALATVPGVDDGVRFDVEALQVTGTREHGIPGGTVTTSVQIGNAVMKFKADVGFYAPELADTLVEVDYPSLLPSLPPIRIMRQPVEYSIADKVHAAVKHAGTNTRLRDYYDLFVYATKCTIDDDRLREAFERTWRLFDDAVPGSIDDLSSYSDRFAVENEAAWAALRARSSWAVDVPDLATVIGTIKDRVGGPMATSGLFL